MRFSEVLSNGLFWPVHLSNLRVGWPKLFLLIGGPHEDVRGQNPKSRLFVYLSQSDFQSLESLACCLLLELIACIGRALLEQHFCYYIQEPSTGHGPDM